MVFFSFFFFNVIKKPHWFEFLVLSYSRIFLKFETIPCKLDLGFKQQGSHEIERVIVCQS